MLIQSNYSQRHRYIQKTKKGASSIWGEAHDEFLADWKEVSSNRYPLTWADGETDPLEEYTQTYHVPTDQNRPLSDYYLIHTMDPPMRLTLPFIQHPLIPIDPALVPPNHHHTDCSHRLCPFESRRKLLQRDSNHRIVNIRTELETILRESLIHIHSDQYTMEICHVAGTQYLLNIESIDGYYVFLTNQTDESKRASALPTMTMALILRSILLMTATSIASFKETTLNSWLMILHSISQWYRVVYMSFLCHLFF